MKKFISLLSLLLIASTSHAIGKIQNEDVKSQADIQSSVLTTTGNLTSGSACIASPVSVLRLVTGLFIYDSTTPGNVPAGTTIIGLPGGCASGQIQMSANAGGNGSGDTLTFGGQLSQLINTSKIYDITNSDLLSTSIATGLLAGASAFQSYALNNLGLSTSAAANALTIALKQRDGSSDPSGGNPAVVSFRSPTAATGAFIQSAITAASSLTIPSGTTIGTLSSVQSYIYIYEMYNGGTPALAVSLRPDFDNGSTQTSVAISGGSSPTALYSLSVISNSPVRLIGRISVTEATAGTWASNSSEISLVPFKAPQFTTFSARIDGRSGGSLVSQSENFISGVTTVSTGQTMLTFVSGAFSSSPFCVCSIHVVQRICSIGDSTGTDNTSPSASAMTIQSYAISGAEDNVMDLICYGKR